VNNISQLFDELRLHSPQGHGKRLGATLWQNLFRSLRMEFGFLQVPLKNVFKSSVLKAI
jgi:hypothetical protein